MKIKEILAEAASDFHQKMAAKHDALHKHHADIGAHIRTGQKGQGYAGSVISGGLAAHHEYAAKQHKEAADLFRSGEGGKARIFARAANMSSERANKKGV